MADGYAVNPASLDRHEQDIRQVMDEVKGAVDSVRDLFDPQAFGIIGIEWSVALNLWIKQHTSCIDSAVRAGNGVADSVRQMSQNYQHTEQNVASGFTSIQSGMRGA